MDPALPKDPNLEIKVSKYRWVVLFLFCLYSCINFIQLPQFTIIANIVMKFYGVQEVLVNLSALIFMMNTIIFAPLANYLITKLSLKGISLLSSGVTTAGAFLKLLVIAPERYYLVMLSQFVCSLAQVLILNLPSKLASLWFGAEEVSTACAICVFGIQGGIAIGFLLPSSFITDTKTPEGVQDGMWKLFGTNASINAVIFLLVLIFFRSKPKFPPSLSQAMQLAERPEQPSILRNLKALFTDKNFLLIGAVFGLANGTYSFLCITLNGIYLHYFPNSEQDVGLISCVSAFVGGTAGNLLFGFLLDKFHQFKLITFIVIFVPAIIYGGFVAVLETGVKAATYVLYPMYGFFVSTTLMIGLEFGTEATFPLPEVAPCSVINATIYIFTIFLVLTLGSFLEAIGYLVVHLILIALMALGCVLLFFVAPTYKRFEANKLKP